MRKFVYSVREHDSRLRDVIDPFYWSTDREKAIEVARNTPPEWSYDQRTVQEHPLDCRLKWDQRLIEVWRRPEPEAKALRVKWEVRKSTKSEFLDAVLSPAQKKLRRKHGTPAQFAAAVYNCVPGDISMDEAKAAIEKYSREWSAAK
jgi:hypothetical protein